MSSMGALLCIRGHSIVLHLKYSFNTTLICCHYPM